MLSIYKASAGSGKTFTLTYRYIKLLLGHKDEKGVYALRRNLATGHRAILAVTFTNKATDEMKRRIIHELAVLAGMEPGWEGGSPYALRLTAELHCSMHALAEAAAKALRNLLFDFNFFQVSTIDSFFQIILRTFAREAELTGNYEVDIDNERAMETGIRNLFTSLRTDASSTESRVLVDLITRFMLNEMNEGRNMALFNRRSSTFAQLIKFVKQTETETFKCNYDGMMQFLADPGRMAAFRTQLAEAPERHKAITAEACRRALDYIASQGYDSGAQKLDRHSLDRLTDGALHGYDTAKKEGKTIKSVIDNPHAALNAKLSKKLTADPDIHLIELLLTAMTHLYQGRRFRKLWAMLIREIYQLGLLNGIMKHIEAFQAENNTFLLSDTNSILKEIIGDGDTPFVFERIGVWLDHFLIDEFQDTSRLQWDVMRPLLMEGQATDSDSLIIGDEKQCIYRFRSSDPTLLQHTVMDDFGDRVAIEGDTPEGNTNWRSSVHVVNFNNELFSRLSANLGLTGIYANVRQNVSPPHVTHDGYIEINSVTASTVRNFNEQALLIMTEAMRRQLRAGYKGKDICVLVRKGYQGTEVIDTLVRLIAFDPDFTGLRVISDDAMTLGSSPAVRLIVSVLRYINRLDAPRPAVSDSADRSSSRSSRLAEINSMLNRFEYLRSRGATAEEAIKEAVTDPTADFDIRHDISSMSCFNLPSLVERIIGRLLSDELDSQCMFISAFQDAVADFCITGPADVHSFLDWWDTKGYKSTVSAPDDDNAIRVMTIHKSKGLEFACVHVPMLCYDMVDFKGNEWFAKAQIPLVDSSVVPPLLPLTPSRMLMDTAFAPQYRKRCDEQLLDELNILYVAFTRASDELSVTFLKPSKASENFPIGQVLDDAIATMTLLTAAGTDEQSDVSADTSVMTYTCGMPTVPQPEKTKRPTALDPVDTFIMPPYATADRDDLWACTKVDDLPDFNEARDRGVMLHEVLSRVNHRHQLRHAINRCTHAGRFSPSDAQAVHSFLSDQLSRPEVTPWFEGFKRAVNERPIHLADGSTLRPDRVVWTADGHIDVIDYKFGSPHKSHITQVKHYMHVLSSMGHSRVRGFLWYVTEGKITTI